MALRQEPGVESQISQSTQSKPVEGGLNIIVPVDSPSGISDPTLCNSVNDFYAQYGSSSAPSANDHPSMLQAASLLNTTAVWVVRCHENKVLEGVTDSGERFYVDKSKNLIKNRLNLTIDAPDNIFDNIWMQFENVCFFSGERPDITGFTPEQYVHLTATNYHEFFEALKTVTVTGISLVVNGDKDEGYKIFSNQNIVGTSSNIVGYSTETLSNTIKLDIGSSDLFTMGNYFMVNSESFHIAGQSANNNKYPSEDTELDFVHNIDQEPAKLVAPYLFDEILTKYGKFVLSSAATLTKIFSAEAYEVVNPVPTYEPVTPDVGDSPADEGWFEKDGDIYKVTEDEEVVEGKTYYTRSYQQNPHDLKWYELNEETSVYSPTADTEVDTSKTYYSKVTKNIVFATNIPESMLTVNAAENTLTALPSISTLDDAYLALTIENKTIVIYNGSSVPKTLLDTAAIEPRQIDGATTAYKMLTLLAEYLPDYKEATGIDIPLAETQTDLYITMNASKLISYAYSLPEHSSVSTVNSYYGKFLGEVADSRAIKFNNVSIIVDDTQYIVGNPERTKSSIVILSKQPINVVDIATAFGTALGSNFNAYVQENSVSCFFTDSVVPSVSTVGLSLAKTTSNYSTVREDNKFGVILPFNSKAKVAQFEYSYDSSTGLFDFTGTVNGNTFQANIQFEDSNRTDGYGLSQYYQYFNDQFKYLEIMPFEGELEQTTFKSPTFGDSIGFNDASTSDLDVALAKLKNYKFTKWEIVTDGGFMSPAGYQVLNKWASKLHMLVDGGTPQYSQITDVVAWRNNLPSNTWYVSIIYPQFRDASFDGFSVPQSAGVAHIKRIVENRNSKNEFLPIFGADYGVVAGRPIYNVNEEEDRNILLSAGINTVYYSDELKLAYINDNSTLCTDDGPLQEENIVRMANAATHVAEVWLELNAVGHFNNLKLRNDIVAGVYDTIATRLASADPCYKELQVICDETNGNDDSKTTVIVDAYLVPYRSAKRIKLFTIVKTVTNE